MAYDDDQQQCVPDDPQTSGAQPAAGAEQADSPSAETAPASDGGAADASVYGDQYGGLDGGASDGGASASGATDGGAQPDVAQAESVIPPGNPQACKTEESKAADTAAAAQIQANNTDAQLRTSNLTGAGAGAACGLSMAGGPATAVPTCTAGVVATGIAINNYNKEVQNLQVAQGTSARARADLEQCRQQNAEPDRGSAGNPR